MYHSKAAVAVRRTLQKGVAASWNGEALLTVAASLTLEGLRYQTLTDPYYQSIARQGWQAPLASKPAGRVWIRRARLEQQRQVIQRQLEQ